MPMQMIELPRSKSPPIDVSVLATPSPDPKSRLILTIALLAIEDPTLLGPEDVQILGRAMLDHNASAQGWGQAL